MNPLKTLTHYIESHEFGNLLIRGASSTLLIKVSGAIMVLVSQLVLAKTMTTNNYGIYAYAFAWLTALSITARVGVDTTFIRFIAEYTTQEKWAHFKGLIRWGKTVVLAACLITIIGVWYISYTFYTASNLTSAITICIAMLALPFSTLSFLQQGALKGLKRPATGELPNTLLRYIFISLFCGGVFIILGRRLEAWEAMFLSSIAAVLSYLIGHLLVTAAIPRQVQETHTPVIDWRLWTKVSLPLFLVSGMYVLITQTSIIMLGALSNSENVAFFSIAIRFANLVAFGMVAVNSIAATIFSELYLKNKTQELQKIVRFSTRGITLFAILSSCTLALIGKYILAWFGQDYIMSYWPMLILLAGHVITALLGASTYLLIMTGHHNKVASILLFSAIICVISNYFLIPAYGIYGAAFATLGTFILRAILMSTAAKFTIGINSWIH